MIQSLLDGVLVGAILSLGAIGLTLVMHILRFANFSHAELLSIGAYAALVFDAAFAAALPAAGAVVGSLSVTASLLLAVAVAMPLTGLSALLVDRLVFRRLRGRAGPLSMVFASFGVALVVRNAIALVFGLGSKLYSDEIAFAMVLMDDPLVLVKPDQLFVLGLTLALMAALQVLLSLTPFGLALQAVSENPTLAAINGVDLDRTIRWTWLIGGALAAVAGVCYGVNTQLSPVMGRDLVLSLFAAVIVGGIGSIHGAVAGGFLVGLASSLAVLVVPSGYKPAVPFIIILATLYVRPSGLFGSRT